MTARLSIAAALAVLLASSPSRGEPPAPAAANEALAPAKDLFQKGVALFEVGDIEVALEYFTRSRALYPSSKNILNVAVCLDRIARYDEALDLYDDLLAGPPDPIEDDERAGIAHAMTALRARVGGLAIVSNVGGSVLIDGRSRGKLPRATAVHALPGAHVVRVVRDGYLAYERRLDVKIGEEIRVDATLAPLRDAGHVRVEDLAGASAAVFVDGVAVGASPWEGTLGPGAHVVWTKLGELGSPPTGVTVFDGETALVRVRSVPLGASVRLATTPQTARLAIDGVTVGAGTWDGRLPHGTHRVVAREAGYREKSASFTVDAPTSVALALEVDPDHARWPKPRVPLSSVSVAAFGGYAVLTDHYAIVAGARASLSFRGFALEAEAGYLSIEGAGGIFSTGDAVRSFGPFVGGGARYRIRAGPAGILLRLTAGALFYSSAKPDPSPTRVVAEGGTGAVAKPEVGVDLRFDRFSIGSAVGWLFVGAATVDAYVLPQVTAEYHF